MMVEERMGAAERRWIDEYFSGRVGNFLEVGSYDGVTDSLSAGLIANSWSGVMCEANPHLFDRLLNNHGKNPNIHLVHAAISDQNGLTDFHDAEGDAQTSTLLQSFVNDCGQGFSYRKYTVPQVNIKDVIEYFDIKQLDLLVIDAEGCGERILGAIPYRVLEDTEVVVAEYYKGVDSLLDLLSPTHEVELLRHPNIIWTVRR